MRWWNALFPETNLSCIWSTPRLMIDVVVCFASSDDASKKGLYHFCDWSSGEHFFVRNACFFVDKKSMAVMYVFPKCLYKARGVSLRRGRLSSCSQFSVQRMLCIGLSVTDLFLDAVASLLM